MESRAKAHRRMSAEEQRSLARARTLQRSATGDGRSGETLCNCPAQWQRATSRPAGVGALVDWQSTGASGNLIWELATRADIAGVDVASKDHAFPSPAAITGYAIGMKRIPVP